MKAIIFLIISAIFVLGNYAQHHKHSNKCGKTMWNCTRTWIASYTVLSIIGATLLLLK